VQGLSFEAAGKRGEKKDLKGVYCSVVQVVKSRR